MVSPEELNRLRRLSAEPVDIDDATDMQTVRISGETSAERLESLIKQTGNPYRYRVGNTVVRVAFLNTEEKLTDKLRRYFVSLKSNEVYTDVTNLP